MAKKLVAEALYETFLRNGVEYFCGVPDSLLRPFGLYLEEHSPANHDIAVNEGNAIALATGYHLATSKIPLVYMQNSGLGNAVNPLLSLADPSVMGISMILLIGWRGEPGKKDEPQHIKQGAVTIDLLTSLGIYHEVLKSNVSDVKEQVKRVIDNALKNKRPVALLVQEGTLENLKTSNNRKTRYSLSREEAIQAIVDSLDAKDLLIATTGKTGRELFEYREKTNQPHDQDLLIVGSMGHASATAYAIAKQKSKRRIFVLDGDGAALMHLGALPFIGSSKLKNFYHIILNNGAHESVGGQPTVADRIDLCTIAKGSGYRHTFSISGRENIESVMKSLEKLDGPILIEINISNSSRLDLMRPTLQPLDNKELFMKFLNID